jgi:hypothetical protein
MNKKTKYIWASAANGRLYLNTATSVMELVQDVMEPFSYETENLEITEMDGKIQISYTTDDGESKSYRISNDCCEFVEFLTEFCFEIDCDELFTIKKLVDSDQESTYDNEPDEAEIASIERHYELYKKEGA